MRNKRELKFIHITKTGGTSIENMGRTININWGRFHREYGFWHGKFKYKSAALKIKYDWFMVVRNPYERILSEFHCRWGGLGGNKRKLENISREEFNNYIINKIKNRNLNGGHYIEQYLYYDKNCKINILRFENLKEDFDKLMRLYNINLSLNKNDNKSLKRFSVNDFSSELINLINKVYSLDFEIFSYPKIIL